jgi:hypothetical protein
LGFGALAVVAVRESFIVKKKGFLSARIKEAAAEYLLAPVETVLNSS